MGYRFHKKGAEPLYIRLRDASVVRAVASIEGLDKYMPRDAFGDEQIPAVLSKTFREQGELLLQIADYFDGAEDLRWDH